MRDVQPAILNTGQIRQIRECFGAVNQVDAVFFYFFDLKGLNSSKFHGFLRSLCTVPEGLNLETAHRIGSNRMHMA